MSVLKRFSFAVALLTVWGCASSSDPRVADDYYFDDYALNEAVPEKKPAPVARVEKETVVPVQQPQTPDIAPQTAYPHAAASVTEVGKKAAAIEARLRQIQEIIRKNTADFTALKNKNNQEAVQYYEIVYRIRARLQNGTTPANPELVAAWKQASALLAASGKSLSVTTKLSGETARMKNEANILLGAVTDTFRMPGAVEADHENLKRLEDEINRTFVALNRLNSEIAAQTTRRQQFFAAERQNISALEAEIRQGKTSDSAEQGLIAAPLPVLADVSVPDFDAKNRRPLMRIPAGVEYEQSLYKAMKAALDKRQNIRFDVVAVFPSKDAFGGYEAVQQAREIKDAMLKMGMPESRIDVFKMQNASINAAEVRLYVK